MPPINQDLLDELRKRQEAGDVNPGGATLSDVWKSLSANTNPAEKVAPINNFGSVDERDSYVKALRAQQPAQQQPTMPPSQQDLGWTQELSAMAQPQMEQNQSYKLPDAPQEAPQVADDSDDEDSSPSAGARKTASNSQAPSAQPVDARTQMLNDLRAKYGLNDKSNAAALEQAQANRAEQNRNALMLEGAAKIGTAFSRGQSTVDKDFYKQLAAQGDQGVKDVQELRKGKLDEMAADKTVDSLADEKLNADPNSAVNKSFQQFLSDAIPAFKNNPGLSAITVSTPSVEKFASVYLQAEAKKAQAQMLHEMQLARIQQGDRRIADTEKQRDFSNSSGAAKTLFKDPEYADAQKSLDSADNALKSLELARTNPIAYGAKAIETARAIVGGGRINVREIDALGGSRAVMARLDQMMQQASTGTMTKENYGFYKELINTMASSAQAHKEHATQKHIAGYAQRAGVDYGTAKQQVLGSPQDATPGRVLDSAPTADPRIQQAKAAGYTDEEIQAYLNGK